MITASETDLWAGLRFLALCVAMIAAIVIAIWLIARSRGTTASLAVRAAAAFAGIWVGLGIISIPISFWQALTAAELEVVPSHGIEWSAYCGSALLCEGSAYLATDVSVGPRLLLAFGQLGEILAMSAPAFAIFMLCMSGLRNTVFPRWIPRLLLVCAGVTLVFGSAAPILTEMGNGLAAAQVLPAEVGVMYYFTVPWWPSFVALACAALAAVFRHGARLQSDTEGLV